MRPPPPRVVYPGHWFSTASNCHMENGDPDQKRSYAVLTGSCLNLSMIAVMRDVSLLRDEESRMGGTRTVEESDLLPNVDL